MKLLASILPLFLFLLLSNLPPAAFAQEKANNWETYKGEKCDYQIGLPGEYQISEETVTAFDDETELTQDVIDYKKIIDLENALNMNATCRQLAEGERDILSTDFIQDALDAYISSNNIFVAGRKVSKDDENNQISGIIIGARGDSDDSFLTTQYWVGSNSLLIFELELTGSDTIENQDVFANILSRVKLKDPS